MSLQEIECEISNLISQKNYPCLAAVRSLAKKEYLIGTYSAPLGAGQTAKAVASDLRKFLVEQKKSQSPWLSFWAVFPKTDSLTEEAFEKALWEELSYLAAESAADKKWDPRFSEDPNSQNFCFSFDGIAFFVVGLHKNSSRHGRRFRYATLIFNLYDQFEELERQGKYESMVKANRSRDVAFQGSVNPMVEQYGDAWETIQFSGKENDGAWKCPFRRLFSAFV